MGAHLHKEKDGRSDIGGEQQCGRCSGKPDRQLLREGGRALPGESLNRRAACLYLVATCCVRHGVLSRRKACALFLFPECHSCTRTHANFCFYVSSPPGGSTFPGDVSSSLARRAGSSRWAG